MSVDAIKFREVATGQNRLKKTLYGGVNDTDS